MHKHATPTLAVVTMLAAAGCGPSEREVELERRLAASQGKLEAIEGRLAGIGQLEKLIEKMSQRQGELDRELVQAKAKADQLRAENERLKKQMSATPRVATARQPPRPQPQPQRQPQPTMPRLSLLDHLAVKVQLAPGQKERVGELLKQGLEQLRAIWLTCKDADAPPRVLDVLQRENRAEVARQIGELLDDAQRQRFRAWQAERERSTVPQQPLQLPPIDELVKPVKAAAAAQREAKLQQFVERNGLTELQVERLRTAETRELEATKRLWTNPDLDLQEARAALERRRDIRQQLATSLEQSLTKPQLDAYVAWRETLVMPQQATARRGWWRAATGAVDDL